MSSEEPAIWEKIKRNANYKTVGGSNVPKGIQSAGNDKNKQTNKFEVSYLLNQGKTANRFNAICVYPDGLVFRKIPADDVSVVFHLYNLK